MKIKTMQTANWQEIEEAKKAALEVLLHNAHGPYHGLPRTAGWGYPEPYTRDLMFSILEFEISRVRLAILGFSKLIFNIQQIEYQVEYINGTVLFLYSLPPWVYL
ncbi:MAG: hypothetical protein Q8P64_13485 [Deltaproteobacteria bacterium]|nr:hypothetical protein [Deltaproteobacteria bacterium]